MLAGFVQSRHSTVAFWHVLHNLCIRRSRFASFCSAFPHPAPTCHCSLRSHFCSFHSLSAFNSCISVDFAPSLDSTVAFWQLFLSAFSHPAPAPRSRIQSHFCSFHSLSAFNCRILAGFAQSLHSTVEFWHLFLSTFTDTPPTCPRSRI